MQYRITGKIGNFDVDLLAVPVEPGERETEPSSPVVSFERPGVFHEATAATPQLRIEDGITPPPGLYSEARIEFDFFFGGLNPSAPGGRHNVCWFVLDGNGSLLFYPLVVRDRFRVGHGVSDEVGVPKVRMEKPFPGTVGWYHVAASYGNGVVKATLEPPSGQILELSDTADVASLEVKSGSRFRAHFGFNGEHAPENEPISLGWRWRNLRIGYRPASSPPP